MKPNPLNKHKMTMRKRQLTSDDVVALKKVKNIHLIYQITEDIFLVLMLHLIYCDCQRKKEK